MPANGCRPTFRSEDTATSQMAVSGRVLEHIRTHQLPGESRDDTLRRLLGIEARKRLELVPLARSMQHSSGYTGT
jgi:hypothetical protein